VLSSAVVATRSLRCSRWSGQSGEGGNKPRQQLRRQLRLTRDVTSSADVRAKFASWRIPGSHTGRARQPHILHEQEAGRGEGYGFGFEGEGAGVRSGGILGWEMRYRVRKCMSLSCTCWL